MVYPPLLAMLIYVGIHPAFNYLQDLFTNMKTDQCMILGMLVVRGLTKNGDVWSDGKLLDPDNGKMYDGKVWLEQGRLKVRGYLLFFYRTQTWIRFAE